VLQRASGALFAGKPFALVGKASEEERLLVA
jgi:hypothetical protein